MHQFCHHYEYSELCPDNIWGNLETLFFDEIFWNFTWFKSGVRSSESVNYIFDFKTLKIKKIEKLKKVLISETVRDRAKRMKICDHVHYNGQDDQN